MKFRALWKLSCHSSVLSVSVAMLPLPQHSGAMFLCGLYGPAIDMFLHQGIWEFELKDLNPGGWNNLQLAHLSDGW